MSTRTTPVQALNLKIGDTGHFPDRHTITDFRPLGHDGRWPMTVAVQFDGASEWRVLPAEAVYQVESEGG